MSWALFDGNKFIARIREETQTAEVRKKENTPLARSTLLTSKKVFKCSKFILLNY